MEIVIGREVMEESLWNEIMEGKPWKEIVAGSSWKEIMEGSPREEIMEGSPWNSVVEKGDSTDSAESSVWEPEHGPEKNGYGVGNRAPSLYDLSLQNAAIVLPQMAYKLWDLPDDYRTPLVRAFLRREPAPSTQELWDFCRVVSYVPQHLSFHGMPAFYSRRIPQALMLPNLVRLDLRGCVWLEVLNFLPALNLLECLNLRGCWRLQPLELLYIRELPRLQCLDVENVPAVGDDLAATIRGLTSLRALNVSGTDICDHFAETLTYGNRLRTWASQQQPATSGSYELQTSLSQHPSSNLTYIRFQGTIITDATIAYLQALSDLQLLDLRYSNVTARALAPLRAKHKLTSGPGCSHLVARTNAMLAGVLLRGDCGCRAMAPWDEFTDEFTKLCQQAFSDLCTNLVLNNSG